MTRPSSQRQSRQKHSRIVRIVLGTATVGIALVVGSCAVDAFTPRTPSPFEIALGDKSIHVPAEVQGHGIDKIGQSVCADRRDGLSRLQIAKSLNSVGEFEHGQAGPFVDTAIETFCPELSD